MRSFPHTKFRGNSLSFKQLCKGDKGLVNLRLAHGTRRLSSGRVSASQQEEWKIHQAGALVANSLQQVLRKSIFETGPILSAIWGPKSSAEERTDVPAEASWSPLSSAIMKLNELRGEDSVVDEAKKAEAALELLQSQADTNEAFQLLKSRAASSSQPGKRKDNFKLGLVVEGGGMRGASSAGSLQALHDLGLRDCFDAVYGSSAGACNATYFLSSQRAGADIYAQHICTTDFIDLRRLLKRNKDPRNALNLSYLLDYVMNKVKPLDWQAVIDSPVPLKIVASCLDSLQPVLLENFVDEHDLRECLRASAAVPVVAGEPVLHRGRRLVDAAVFEAIPLRAAIADGCTHCIVLPTRPPFKKGDYVARWIDEAVSGLVIKAVLSPGWMREAWIKELQYQRSFGVTAEELLIQSLESESHKLPGMEGVHIFPVFPGPASSYSPMCIDEATVMLGVAEGRNAILRIFGSLGVCPIPDHSAQAPKRTQLTSVPPKTVKVGA